MKKQLLPFTIIFFILFLGFMINFSSVPSDYTLSVKPDTLWNENWSFDESLITLTSQKLDVPVTETIYLQKNLPTIDLSNQYLLFRGSLSDVKVAIDNQYIYQSQRANLGVLNSPPASLWHLVPLNKEYAGRQVTIELQSDYIKMHGLMNPVYLGSRGDLMFNIINQYGTAFIIDIIILIIGFILMITAFVNPKKTNNSIWYVGSFSIIVAFWLIAESKLLQFFMGHQLINASLAYISLAIIPIPFLLYVKTVISTYYHRILNSLIGLSLFTLIAIIVLQFSGWLEFFNTVPMTHGVIVINILIVTSLLLRDIVIEKNKNARNLSFAFGVLFLFVLIEIVRFQLIKVLDVTVFTRLGLLFFIIMLGFQVLRQLVVQVEKSYKAEFYESLAFHDSLTQGFNRMAFEKDMESLFKLPNKLNKLRLVILDMNELKSINDTYGHVVGDDAIKNAYWIIHDSFSHLGKTYRIGGDEFAVIIENSDETAFFKTSVSLYDSICHFNQEVNYPFSIAFGSVVYHKESDLTAEKMLHRADTNMYYEKNRRYKVRS